MLASEMDSAFGPRDVRFEGRDLSWLQIGNGTARPGIVIPDLHKAALVILPYPG
jgi:hypothetical protein